MMVLVILLLLCTGCQGLQYQHDELLWTKQRWQDYKLSFPWAAFAKDRDAESVRQLEGPLHGFSVYSLNGPLLDAAEVERRIEEDSRRGPGLQQSSFELTLLDDEASQEAAAGVAQCKVCSALARHLWEGLTGWVNRRRQVPNKRRIEAFAKDLCEYEVPNEVLKGWVLLRVKVQQAQGLPFAAAEGQTQEFYMLSQRVKQHATPQEIAAVRLSCHKLLHGDGAAEGGKDSRQLLHLTSHKLHQYYQTLAQRAPRGPGAIGSGSGDSSGRAEVVEAVDDGPRAQRECYNRHPQCDLWLEKGECQTNPKYMLGDEGKKNGWCMPACGKCKAPAEEDAGSNALSAKEAAAMQGVQSELLAVLQAKACVAAAPCKWAAGEGMKELLAQAKKGADKEAATLMDSAAFISGPLLSWEQQLESVIDQTRLKESQPMLQRALDDAIVPERQQNKKGGGKRSASLPPAPTDPAGKAAHAALEGQCLYVSTGWWMYEVCYQHYITQFHMTDKHDIDWVIALGQYESSNWTLASTSRSGLYPENTLVPYVSQLYSKGGHCERDADPEAGGEARPPILRRAELHLMCSPDAHQHIIIVEPQQCIYTVELYLPQLCSLPGFAVELPSELRQLGAGSGRRRAQAQAGGSAGTGAATATDDDRDSYADANEDGEEAAYALPTQTEDDPYIDPDEL